MSRSVDIDLTFGPPVRLEALLSGLASSGWSPVHDGKINFMVDYDWRYADAEEREQVLATMAEALDAGNVAGISVWTPEGPGANLLAFPGGEKVSLSLDLNRRLYEGSAIFADLGWYLARIVPPLESLGLSSVAARDTYP
jgi:hypothetical protein